MQKYPDKISESTSSRTRTFGPFRDVPTEDVKPAGFKCKVCHRLVEKFAMVLPGLVVRMLFYGCLCGTLVVYEDEAQPQDARTWRLLADLMNKTGAKVLIFNGNRELSPDFNGLN